MLNPPEHTLPDPPLPAPGKVPDAPSSDVGPTWEDDESTGTRVLRAVFALLAGGVLLYAQWNFPYSSPNQAWGKWIWTAVLFNFLLPVGIVWMFFGQGLTYQDWLRDQRNNAWNYGWNWTKWKRYALFSLGVLALMSPFLWFASRDVGARESYQDYFLPPTDSAGQWALVLATLVVYMFAWEWCFRGFLLFGTAQGFGWIAAVALQATMFGLAHAGKPPMEFWSSFLGGGALGVICWREKSFVPAFFIHALVQCVWSVMVRI